ILDVEMSLGELWDCQLGNPTAGKSSGGGGEGLFMQLGNLTAGKGSGGRGEGLFMGELGLQGKRGEVNP
ncbi:hypothetical protein Tco_0338581, partial [Tanacetum coccineum]